MKKLVLPDNYTDLVAKAIKQEDSTIACVFFRIFDFIVRYEEIDKIHPDNVNISFAFMDWIMDMPTKFSNYTNVQDLEWAWFLLGSGPMRNRKIEEFNTVLYFEDLDEIKSFMKGKGVEPSEIIYLKAKITNNSLKVFERQPKLYSMANVVLLK